MNAIYIILDWMTPIVNGIGVGVATWAYRMTRKNGYLLIAVYFSLALIVAVTAPYLRARSAKYSPLSEDVQQRLYEATEEILGEAVHTAILPVTYYFPLGNIILVTGLFLLARNEKKKNAEPDNQPADDTWAGDFGED